MYDSQLWRDDAGTPYAKLGFVVFVPGMRPVVARAVLPSWAYHFLSQDAKTLKEQGPPSRSELAHLLARFS